MAMDYKLYNPTEDNAGTDVVTPGFLIPLEDLVRDAIGANGACIARINANRQSPQVLPALPLHLVICSSKLSMTEIDSCF